MNTPFYISGRDRTNPPNRVSPTRYQFLSLKDAEPNLGVPLSNALPASATWVLTTDALGNRYFSTTLLYDSTYSTFKGTSADFVSVFTTVQHTSANWQSTYTTLNTNSGTWLTVTSANSLYFKTSGGLVEGDIKIQGNVLIVGALSALSGLEFITTKATTTSSLSIVNVGFGPALYVSQDGFYDIAKFYDAEGGIAMLIGNITPPGAYTGLVGIKTEYPNKTLTVVGDISSTQGFYTEGPIVSAGVTLDTIIFNAVPPTLQSVYATVSANSGSWTNVYQSWSSTSAQYVSYNSLSTTRSYLCAADVFGDVFIYGNLVAQGSAFFTNTIVSVTSALSVINSGQGPALFVSQGKGQGDIASFYDADYGNEVLHIGNAVDFNGNVKDGVIGIKTGTPNKTLTVVGEISSTGKINDLKVLYNAGNVILGENVNTDTAGINNVFVGNSPAIQNAFGSANIFIGQEAGRNNYDGSENVFIGTCAGRSSTFANSNVAIGTCAGLSLDTSLNNVIIGKTAGINVAQGTHNVIIGKDAGCGITSANYNIIIGTGSDAPSNRSRTVVIGNGAQATQDFQFVAGAPDFPFVNGRYFGDLAIYGTLSGANLGTQSFSAINNATFYGNTTFNKNVVVLGSLTIGSTTSASNTRIDGDVTITKSLSVPALSAEYITAYKPITAFGGVVGMRYQYNSQTFNSNGSQTNFSLISAVYSVNEILVFVSGVYQNKSAFYLTDNLTLTMTEPVPAGTGILEVVYLNYNPLPIQQTYITVDDGSLGAIKLATNAVTTTKIADANVTPAKLSTGGPSWTTTSDFIVTGNLSAHNISPRANNSYDLGSTTLRWRNIYTQDLHLNNAVGDYTIVEGEDNLYIINNKKKKTYKFALIEVDPAEVPKVSKTD